MRPLTLLAFCLAAPALPAAERPAEVVLVGGEVVTLDGGRPRGRALAIRAGRIVAVGDEGDVKPFLGPSTRRIDLAGRAVVPGLTDAHVHVEGLGQARESLDLVGARSLEEALARVAERARTLPPDEWLIGRGWDQNDWPGQRFPTAVDLDRAAPDRPVYLTRVDGHAGWVNSRALARAGLGAETPDPPGGRILRDESGRPTGILVDAAQPLVRSRIPPPSREARKRRIVRGLEACAAAGLTSVHDAGVDPEAVTIYKELLAAGALPIRVYVMLRGAGLIPDTRAGGTEGLGGAALPSKPEVGLGDGLLTVRSIKIVADGALGSRGALLLEPYSDEPGTRGLATVEPGAFRRLLRAALVRGFQVATHAIGDAANRSVLDAYQEAGVGPAQRFRVEHAQVISPRDVPRFKALGVIPSMQPTHCTSDMYWATDRLGPERARGAYLWKTFLEQGVPVAAGSDAPVEKIDVLPGLYAAVTRQDAQGWPEGGWHPAERVTILEALRMFGRDAAFAAFEEEERGVVARGRRADLTVLTRDITDRPPGEILETSVWMTVVGGKVVYGRQKGEAPGYETRGPSAGVTGGAERLEDVPQNE